MRLRRSLHFVPGGNEKMIAKALALPADGLILDLEDAVAPDRKAATRPIVREWLQKLDFGGRERWVRMNPISTDLAVADLEETITGRPDGYVVPKPRRASDIREIDGRLDRLEREHSLPLPLLSLKPGAMSRPRCPTRAVVPTVERDPCSFYDHAPHLNTSPRSDCGVQ